MQNQLIITNLTRNQTEYTVCGLYEKKKLVEVQVQPKDSETLLGNIYVGRVKDVVKNLNAAFIEIAAGLACYFSLEDMKNPIYVKKINSPSLVKGDELYVQVEKESMKTKPPQVTANLSFTGKYLVLTTGNQTLGVSRKIDRQTGGRLKSLMEGHMDPDFGLVLRTNSQTATEEQILSELKELTLQARTLLKKAPYQACFSCVRRQPPEFLTVLKNVYTEQLSEIVTDDEGIFAEIQAYLKEFQPEDLPKLRLYQDDMLSLSKCYCLEVNLEDALKERVWLKSGGYLLIQPTEALTVIDVNSGKSTVKVPKMKGEDSDTNGKTNVKFQVQEHYLKVNLEAAKEIAAQLRLRNISGIIVVDFIDMVSEEAREQLMDVLRAFTKKDPVPVSVVDMTKLNLVELTRKKVRKSLREQFS